MGHKSNSANAGFTHHFLAICMLMAKAARSGRKADIKGPVEKRCVICDDQSLAACGVIVLEALYFNAIEKAEQAARCTARGFRGAAAG